MNPPVSTFALYVIFTLFLVGPCVAFHHQPLSFRTSRMLTIERQHSAHKTPFTTKLAGKDEGSGDEIERFAVEDDDDGWGTSATDDFEEKTKELRALQNSRQAVTQSSTQAVPGGERDLFIPIFAVVSLLGLFGSYGYEMMRLASRGELYLPWNN